MVPDAEKQGAVFAGEDDPRVTRVGRFLRRTRLDEFPQLINILRGEMSAVGPRPERPEHLKELEKEIPFHPVRLAVRPGMAGWAQVNYGYVSSVEDARLRLEYDLYYIKHQSLWLDVVIILRMMAQMLMLRGR
jgi:lipopolysaccharide/colanic/teichoic acid biosynthesis glycosyltransferase